MQYMNNHNIGIYNRKKLFYTILTVLTVAFVLLMSMAVELLIENDQQNEKEALNSSLYTTSQAISQQIQQSLATGISTTESLLALLHTSDFDTTNFDLWAKSLIKTNPSLSVIQLAPDGIVSFIYPLQGNKSALGHNLLTDSRRDDGALKAIHDRALTFIGPVKLIQNGRQAVIARRPIFIGKGPEEKFWGFTIALMYIDQILPFELTHFERLGIQYQLDGSNPDAQENLVLASSPGYEDHKDNIRIPIKVPNGVWMLNLRKMETNKNWYLPVRIGAFFISILIALFIEVQQIRMHRQAVKIVALNKDLKELSYRDELTSLGNRRAALTVLSNLVSQGMRYDEPLSVVLMDADLFKEVNDTFGHPVGDAYLRHVAVVLKESVRESDVLARLGGDEFVCIFPRTNLESAQIAVKKIRYNLNHSPLRHKEHEIPLSFSFGLVEIKKGEGVEELIAAADVQLYRAKKAGQNKFATELAII